MKPEKPQVKKSGGLGEKISIKSEIIAKKLEKGFLNARGSLDSLVKRYLTRPAAQSPQQPVQTQPIATESQPQTDSREMQTPFHTIQTQKNVDTQLRAKTPSSLQEVSKKVDTIADVVSKIQRIQSSLSHTLVTKLKHNQIDRNKIIAQIKRNEDLYNALGLWEEFGKPLSLSHAKKLMNILEKKSVLSPSTVMNLNQKFHTVDHLIEQYKSSHKQETISKNTRDKIGKTATDPYQYISRERWMESQVPIAYQAFLDEMRRYEGQDFLYTPTTTPRSMSELQDVIEQYTTSKIQENAEKQEEMKALKHRMKKVFQRLERKYITQSVKDLKKAEFFLERSLLDTDVIEAQANLIIGNEEKPTAKKAIAAVKKQKRNWQKALGFGLITFLAAANIGQFNFIKRHWETHFQRGSNILHAESMEKEDKPELMETVLDFLIPDSQNASARKSNIPPATPATAITPPLLQPFPQIIPSNSEGVIDTSRIATTIEQAVEASTFEIPTVVEQKTVTSVDDVSRPVFEELVYNASEEFFYSCVMGNYRNHGDQALSFPAKRIGLVVDGGVTLNGKTYNMQGRSISIDITNYEIMNSSYSTFVRYCQLVSIRDIRQWDQTEFRDAQKLMTNAYEKFLDPNTPVQFNWSRKNEAGLSGEDAFDRLILLAYKNNKVPMTPEQENRWVQLIDSGA